MTATTVYDRRGDKYGKMCHGYSVSPQVVPSPPRSPKLQNRNPWVTVHQCLQINLNIHSQTDSNGVVVGQQLYVVNHPTLPMASFGSEEKRKPQGTGAYFPNVNSRPYRDRLMPGRGRNQTPGTHGQLQRYTRNINLVPASQELNLHEEGSVELALEGYPVLDSAKSRSSETYFSQPSTQGSHYANGSPHSSEKHKPGCISPHLCGPPRTEVSSHPESIISTSRGSVPAMGKVAQETSDSLAGTDHKRIEVHAYRLKNDDFPPLSQ